MRRPVVMVDRSQCGVVILHTSNSSSFTTILVGPEIPLLSLGELPTHPLQRIRRRSLRSAGEETPGMGEAIVTRKMGPADDVLGTIIRWSRMLW